MPRPAPGVVSIGVNERDGGTSYNTQLLFDADGKLIRRRRKIMNNIADDATVEGSMLNGAVQGADAVRSVVLTIRSLYEHPGTRRRARTTPLQGRKF